ncbi:hypothetical protein GCM10010995_14830 [Cysteiniphilum litorale]|uniref:Cytidylate kinase n=1 Tax=Cysteiniphilum litorale TaxID=2056700 RepID=A0A8J2Z4N5_9GAMM|nr:hypothetical protein GCM10010995_14830 [Cysteiniphilum litorale]
MSNKVEIITIDGPSGVGKGTLSRLLAQKLDYALLDSGAIYRLAALYVLDHVIDISHEQLLYDELSQLNIHFAIEGNQTKAFLDGMDVTTRIRQEQTGMMASKIAKISIVRDALLACQQAFAQGVKGLVADGRDMGTVVFPNARHKFFLEAGSQIRAQRRYDELIAKGQKADFTEILTQLEARDHQDRNREVAPLRPAEDALIIDTSSLDIDGVFAKVYAAVKLRNNKQMTVAIDAYYQLLIKAIDQLGYAPEFLNAPQKIDQANTRLLCQTRSLFFLLTYAGLTNTQAANAYAYKLYQVMKSQYFDEQSKAWIKTQSSKDGNDLYEYAFVLFTLSVLYGTFKEHVISEDIEHVNELITQKFIADDFKALKDQHGVIGQNALMHLFEAYLGAYRHTQNPIFKTQAEALYQKIIALFFDHERSLMREYSREDKSALFEPGHSFEWSSLIVEAQALGVDVDIMSDHIGLYQAATKVGINDCGFIKPNLSHDVKDMQYRIWPMLEYMRYLAMTASYEHLDNALSIFSTVFLKHDLPIEYVDSEGAVGFDDVKSTTGYHLINCWQYMLR